MYYFIFSILIVLLSIILAMLGASSVPKFFRAKHTGLLAGAHVIVFAIIMLSLPFLIVFGTAYLTGLYGYGGLGLLTEVLTANLAISFANIFVVVFSIRKGLILRYRMREYFIFLTIGICIMIVFFLNQTKSL